ncbi:hypothetical protein [Amycolatopsis sp. NPDC049868]|uniref:hypothetical protein n=1 Tax=Amycolatopsis sp. NPDC049868 TaxID=3363934 RepID=UPI00379E7EFB
MGLVPAMALLQQSEVGLAGVVVGHDLPVQHCGPAIQGRGQNTGELANSPVKSMPLRLVNRVAPSGAICIDVR